MRGSKRAGVPSDRNRPRFGPFTSPVVIGETAYVASADTYVYAIDAQSGTVRWRTHNPGGHFNFAVDGNRLFALSDEAVYAYPCR